MTNKVVLLSVIVCAYNEGGLVREALDSVWRVSQTFPLEIEVIVICDGATPATDAAIADWTSRVSTESLLERLTVISQENRGLGEARNRGIEASRGQWCAFLDADDCWSVEGMVEAIEILRSLPRGDVLRFGFRFIVDGLVSGTELPSLHARGLLSGTPGVWRNLYRREFLVRNGVGFPRVRFMEDLPFLAQVSALNPIVDSYPVVVYNYRALRAHSLSNVSDDRWLEVAGTLRSCRLYLREGWTRYYLVFAARHSAWAVVKLPRNRRAQLKKLLWQQVALPEGHLKGSLYYLGMSLLVCRLWLWKRCRRGQ